MKQGLMHFGSAIVGLALRDGDNNPYIAPFTGDLGEPQYLELAVSGQASVIITGDRDLPILHSFQDISIVTAQVFLQQY